MTKPLLDEKIRQQVLELFHQLEKPVHVIFFGTEAGCDYCPDTLQLIKEVAGISEKIRLRSLDLDRDAVLAKHYRVDKVPMLVIAGEYDSQIHDYGVRFAGIPAGHEFSSLIHVIVMISRGDSTLKEATRLALKQIKKPVQLQVFVTPT